MDNQPYHIEFDVWGDFAAFTRPEFKVERYSYDVPTPSSMRNLLQSIYWHPQFQYRITDITVFNPVLRVVVTKNELSSVMRSSNALQVMKSVFESGTGKPLGIPASAPRQQRCTTYLKDVYYRIGADIIPNSVWYDTTHDIDQTFDPEKAYAIITRRLERGQYYYSPYLGLRECVAYYALHRYPQQPESVYKGQTIDLGIMYFDSDYSDPDDIRPHFYHPFMVDGKITVPPTEEVMRYGA